MEEDTWKCSNVSSACLLLAGKCSKNMLSQTINSEVKRSLGDPKQMLQQR